MRRREHDKDLPCIVSFGARCKWIMLSDFTNKCRVNDMQGLFRPPQRNALSYMTIMSSNVDYGTIVVHSTSFYTVDVFDMKRYVLALFRL